MLAEQALEHSASKTAQLHSKVNAQEVRKSNNIIIMKWMEQPNNLEYINIENCIFFNGNDHVGVVSMTNLEIHLRII